MKILILGGTRFVGRSLVETAISEGHEVTLFNRGKTNPDLFPELELIVGDRDSELRPLHGRKWDVVVDTCGYVPRIVKKSAEMLADSVEHYTFISSISAYADFAKPGIDENSLLATIEDEAVEKVTDETYGPLKVLCEKAVRSAMPGRILVLRCGLIVGHYDPSDRFTYWPVRMSQGGKVLAPSPPQRQIQFIDARDLAQFILSMAQKRQTGTFNTTGPVYTLTMQRFLEECNGISGNRANLTWVSEDFIIENKAIMPVWVPEGWTGMFQVNCKRANAAGLTLTPLTTTIRDTVTWHATRPVRHQLKAGLETKREEELLRIWYEQNRNGR